MWTCTGKYSRGFRLLTNRSSSTVSLGKLPNHLSLCLARWGVPGNAWRGQSSARCPALRHRKIPRELLQAPEPGVALTFSALRITVSTDVCYGWEKPYCPIQGFFEDAILPITTQFNEQ